MKEMEYQHRPREKALRFGLETLSNQELLCLVLQNGTARRDVFSVAEELLKKTEDLETLFYQTPQMLMEIDGIGKARASSICACLELARRCQKAKCTRQPVHSPQDVAEWFQTEYGTLQQEHFVALFLDSRGYIIRHKTIFVGTLNQAPVHPRDLFREACSVNASAILFVHNHPSNDPTPSGSDLKTTAQLCQAAQIIGIQVLDHIIVGRDCLFSFKEHNLLEEIIGEDADAVFDRQLCV